VWTSGEVGNLTTNMYDTIVMKSSGAFFFECEHRCFQTDSVTYLSESEI